MFENGQEGHQQLRQPLGRRRLLTRSIISIALIFMADYIAMGAYSLVAITACIVVAIAILRFSGQHKLRSFLHWLAFNEFLAFLTLIAAFVPAVANDLGVTVAAVGAAIFVSIGLLAYMRKRKALALY